MNVAIGLLERITAQHVDILLKEVTVLVGLPLVLSPFDLETEDARVLSEDVSLQEGEVDVFWWFYYGLVVFIAHIVPAAEELLLLICSRDNNGSGSYMIIGVTYDLLGGYFVEVGWAGDGGELHDSWIEVVHVEALDDLIEL